MSRWKERPLVSAALVAVNVIVFIVCILSGERLYDLGGLSAFWIILRKEYWRVVSAMFLHADINHLFNNMLILFFLGAMIEKEIGHVRYALLFFLSGIGGNLLSLYVKVVTDNPVMSVGASGAVFGLDGVLLSMVLFWDRKLPSVTPARVILMVIFSLYSGFSETNIDNAAHVGGLLAGFLAGCVVCLTRRGRSRHIWQGRQ